MPRNVKAPLIQALDEAGYKSKDTWGGARQTFTNVRRNGQRRIKIWFAGDIWYSRRRHQLALEAALKRNYGEAYLGGYFIQGRRGPDHKSFCVVLDNKLL